MNSGKKENYKFSYNVIEMLFRIGKDHMAYMEESYSLDNILEFLENPKNKGATSSHKNKFSKLTYSPFYRKRSSSGQIAKTSIVQANFQMCTILREDGSEIEGINIKWPYHLLRKEHIIIPLSNDTNIIEIEDKVMLMTIEELEAYAKNIYATTVYNILKKTLKSSGINKADFSNLSREELKDHILIKEMMGV